MGRKEKGNNMSNDFVAPDQAMAQYAADKKKRDEEYNEKHRLKEGEYSGRILKIGEEASRANNPMYVLALRINKGNDGKPQDENKKIVRSLNWHMEEFYDIIKEAGFDLKSIKTPEILGDVLNKFAEAMPTCNIVCSHQKNSTYNNYEVKNVEKIGEGFFGVVEPEKPTMIETPAPEAEKATSTSVAPKNPETKKSSSSTYTKEEIMELDKDDCLEVAEELGVQLKAKVKSKMRKELIAFIEGGSKKEAEKPAAKKEVEKPAESKAEGEAPAETVTTPPDDVEAEFSPFPDQD